MRHPCGSWQLCSFRYPETDTSCSRVEYHFLLSRLQRLARERFPWAQQAPVKVLHNCALSRHAETGETREGSGGRGGGGGGDISPDVNVVCHMFSSNIYIMDLVPGPSLYDPTRFLLTQVGQAGPSSRACPPWDGHPLITSLG